MLGPPVANLCLRTEIHNLGTSMETWEVGKGGENRGNLTRKKEQLLGRKQGAVGQIRGSFGQNVP